MNNHGDEMNICSKALEIKCDIAYDTIVESGRWFIWINCDKRRFVDETGNPGRMKAAVLKEC